MTEGILIDRTVPELLEIDLSQTTNHGGAGLEAGATYLVLHGNRFYAGTFEQQWYGLNFQGIYAVGAQYDPPGTNRSLWQRIWKISNSAEIIPPTAAPLPIIDAEFHEIKRRFAGYVTDDDRKFSFSTLMRLIEERFAEDEIE